MLPEIGRHRALLTAVELIPTEPCADLQRSVQQFMHKIVTISGKFYIFRTEQLFGNILILSFHLCLGFPNGLFVFRFPHQTLYVLLFSPHLPHAQPIAFSFICWEVEILQVLSPASCQSHSGPHRSLNTRWRRPAITSHEGTWQNGGGSTHSEPRHDITSANLHVPPALPALELLIRPQSTL